MENSKHLIANIEKLRNEMITVGINNGFESTEVIFLSQELDLLIYEFQKQLNSLQIQFTKIRLT